MRWFGIVSSKVVQAGGLEKSAMEEAEVKDGEVFRRC